MTKPTEKTMYDYGEYCRKLQWWLEKQLKKCDLYIDTSEGYHSGDCLIEAGSTRYNVHWAYCPASTTEGECVSCMEIFAESEGEVYDLDFLDLDQFDDILTDKIG